MCKGEPCNIIEYDFDWKDARVVEASGEMRNRQTSERSSDPDILDAVKDSISQHPALLGKALENKSLQTKDLPRRIEHQGGGRYRFVDAACGGEGQCMCLPLPDGAVVKLANMKKRFRIRDLDGITAHVAKGPNDCVAFSIVVEVEAAVSVIEGRCISRETTDF